MAKLEIPVRETWLCRSRIASDCRTKIPILPGMLSKIKPKSKKTTVCIGRTHGHSIPTACVLQYGPARSDIFRGWMNWSSGRHIKDVLMSKVEVTEYISAGEIEEIMDPEKYIGTAVEQVEAVVERIRNKL